MAEYTVAEDTDIGTKRKVNQDRTLIRLARFGKERAAFAVLCDGMGGLSEGEVAAEMAVDAFAVWFEELFSGKERFPDPETALQQMQEVLHSANYRIYEYGRQKGITAGTTVSALLLTAGRYAFVHVGDSRIYSVGETVVQLTEDHSVTAREIREGRLTPEQARADKRRNQLLRCAGGREKVEPQTGEGSLQGKRGFFLCCDGLWHETEHPEIQAVFRGRIRTGYRLQKRLRQQISRVLERGEKDNVSAAAIWFGRKMWEV